MQQLPFAAQPFDGILTVNLVEHLHKPQETLRECARLLAPGGIRVVITPNGDGAWALELAELLRMKLPEGPHRFLTPRRLRTLVEEGGFDVVSQEHFILFPVGPSWLANGLERWRTRCCPQLGLMQCVVATKRHDQEP